MDQQQIQHAFVNKPFYKRFRKCTECRKRIIWTQIAKCTGCKTYCHRRCIQTNNDVCYRPNPIESTAQITNSDLETVVTRSNEDDRNSKMILLPEDDIKDLNPTEGEVVADRLENSANVSCAKISKIAEQRPYAPNDSNLGASTGPQDEYSEAMEDATPSEDVMSVDECSTVLANEELQAAEPVPTPSDDYRMTADECSSVLSNEEVQADVPMLTPSDDVMTEGECSTVLPDKEVQADVSMPTPSGDGMMAKECSMALSGEEVQTKPIRDDSALKIAPFHLLCTEIETDESQNTDNGLEQNKCNGDDGVPSGIAGEKKLGQPL